MQAYSNSQTTWSSQLRLVDRFSAVAAGALGSGTAVLDQLNTHQLKTHSGSW